MYIQQEQELPLIRSSKEYINVFSTSIKLADLQKTNYSQNTKMVKICAAEAVI